MHQTVTKPIDSTRRWWVLAIVVAAQFMFGVDAFIVNVAIPTIAVDLHATPAQIEALAHVVRDEGFGQICVNTWHVTRASAILKGSPARVVACVSFPMGALRRRR